MKIMPGCSSAGQGFGQHQAGLAEAATTEQDADSRFALMHLGSSGPEFQLCNGHLSSQQRKPENLMQKHQTCGKLRFQWNHICEKTKIRNPDLFVENANCCLFVWLGWQRRWPNALPHRRGRLIAPLLVTDLKVDQPAGTGTAMHRHLG